MTFKFKETIYRRNDYMVNYFILIIGYTGIALFHIANFKNVKQSCFLLIIKVPKERK